MPKIWQKWRILVKNVSTNNNNFFLWPLIAAVFILFLSIVLVILAATNSLNNNPELITGSIIVLGISIILVLLFIMSAGFHALNMQDNSQALGLPKGSIRAIIAILLIVMMVILSVFLFGAAQSAKYNPDMIKLAQQLITIMGTLVVAVSAFYFGSRSVAAAHEALTPATSTPHPVIRNVDPSTGKQGAIGLPLTIQGRYFRLPKEVRFVQGSDQIEGTGIISNDTEIQCTISILADQKLGKWDLIVVNEDGGQDLLNQAFEVIVA